MRMLSLFVHNLCDSIDACPHAARRTPHAARRPPPSSGYARRVGGVRLRALRDSDLDTLAEYDTPEHDPWNAFEIGPRNAARRRFADNGGIADDRAVLAVENEDGDLIGSVSWFSVQHGPTAACRAINIGISLFPPARGKGYGTDTQRQLAEYLFRTKLVERIEAGTDIDNIAEQRALESAGFTREGVLRHAQFRAGEWRDVVLYSRLRSDLVQ